MSLAAISTRLEDLLPSIRSSRAEIERARQLPRSLARSLCETGIFALSVPRALGGEEAEPTDLMAAIEQVSKADGSTGWCAMVGIGNNVAAGYMKEEAAREVFTSAANPTAGIAAPAGLAVRTNGGVRVTGRWSFASGITHSDWVWAGCLVLEDGHPKMTAQGPEIIHVTMPVHQVSVDDTWYVSGLRGTGSHDFGVEDVFVPEHRIFRLLDPEGHRPEPLYQMPPLGLFVYQLACVGLGIARAALDEIADVAPMKTPTLYQEALADRPVFQIEIARAEAALGGARAYLYEVVEEIWGVVRTGGSPSMRQLALARAAATQAIETAASVTRTANSMAGGPSLFNGSSLQRHMRDAEAITHHFTVAPFVWEQAGRALLGREPGVPVI